LTGEYREMVGFSSSNPKLLKRRRKKEHEVTS